MYHRYLNERFGTLDGALVIFRQSARSIEPAKGTFDDPTLRLHDEAFLAVGRADNFQTPPPQDQGPRNDRAIGGIDPDHFREFHLTAKLRQRFLSARSILHRRRCDHQSPDQAEGINNDMPLAAGDFFSPRRSPLARLVPWFSHSGCPEWQPWAWALAHRADAHASVSDRECGPRCRLFARHGSSERQCGRVAGRAAVRAKLRRCAPDRESRSRFPGACTWRAFRRILAPGQASEWHSIAHPSGRSGKTSLSCRQT